MPFVLEPLEEILLPVRVIIPGRDAQEFRLRVKYHGRKAAKKFLGAEAEKTDGDDIDSVAEIILGWEEFQDKSGKPVAYSKDKLREVCDNPHIKNAIIQAILRELSGNTYLHEALAKN